MMTDLEMTRLCAEAIGKQWNADQTDYIRTLESRALGPAWCVYDPLHDDAQAMALVRKFRLIIVPRVSDDGWNVGPAIGQLDMSNDVSSNGLNRAIVECVAKMQQAKVTR